MHDRQPVILPDEAALATWLDTSPGKWTPELTKLCEPYHSSADHPLVWCVFLSELKLYCGAAY